jgi:hypothetical protein
MNLLRTNMKTRTEIIQETVDYYSEDVSRRAVTDGGCEYLTKDGRSCAVGRCFTEEGLKEYKDCNTIFIRQMLFYFKDEYKIDDSIFWEDLQHLHDHSLYWCNSGLSKSGEKYVEKLLLKYKEKNV